MTDDIEVAALMPFAPGFTFLSPWLFSVPELTFLALIFAFFL